MSEIQFDNALRRQVMSLPQLMRDQYNDLEPKVRKVLSTPEIFSIQRIVLTGCGDSYAAILATKEAFEKLTKIRVEVVPTVELARLYDKRLLGFAPNNPLVIAISNSGQVARIGEAVARCNRNGAFTLGITGNEESVLGQNSQRILKLDIPKFESAPGTRTYMCSVMALYLLAIRIGEVRGRYTMDEARSHRKDILAHADALEQLLPAMDATALELAKTWKDFPAFDFLGTGMDFGAAWFSHAKVLEAIGRYSMHINTEEWLHLNFFMREAETLGTTIYCTKSNPAWSRTLETIRYAAQLERPLAVITDADEEEIGVPATYFKVPKTKHDYAMALSQYAPICLLMGYIQTMLGEKSGRGCEGRWAFAKGAACVRQSEIVEI